MLHYSHRPQSYTTMASQYYDEFSGFNIDRALIDFNGDIVEVSSYAKQNGERADFLKAYREKVKQWMKYNHKNMKWLASQIGMSEGSTKNLLYTNLNITPEKLAAIQKAMDEGLEGVEHESIYWLCIKAFKWSVMPDFPAWSIAAEIPMSCFTLRNLEEHPYQEQRNLIAFASKSDSRKLAEWATRALMREAAVILRPVYEHNKQHFDSSLFRNKSKKEINLFWCGDDLRLFGGYDILTQDRDSETGDEYETLSIPIISEQWKSVYIELAISLNNQSVAEWVISTLNKEAHKQGLANLADFISSTLD